MSNSSLRLKQSTTGYQKSPGGAGRPVPPPGAHHTSVALFHENDQLPSSQTQKIEWWLQGLGEGRVRRRLMGTGFQCGT